jgi:hypothetical protein
MPPDGPGPRAQLVESGYALLPAAAVRDTLVLNYREGGFQEPDTLPV